MTQAPSYMGDAARADGPAEDRVTAGERAGERPQGLAPRLRRTRRAVLQEACSLTPAFRRRVVSLLPPRRRRDRVSLHAIEATMITPVRTKPRGRRRAASPTTARA